MKLLDFMGREKRAARQRWRTILGVAVAAAALAVTCLLWPMDTERYLTVRSSGEMLDRSGRLLHPFLNEDEQWCFERKLKDISPYLVMATVAAEDQRFREHHGVDPAAVFRAVIQNVRCRRIVSGASTLTMQVVKQADDLERTLLGKARQAVGAVRLDLRVPKDRIIEAYLNSAPYGLNLIGCEAAARRYFGKPARELSVAEAALLAGLPKAPSRLMPLEHAEAARERRDYVLQRMAKEGFITEATLRHTLEQPLTVKWHEFPRLSPHLAMHLRPEITDGMRAITTLDAPTQQHIEHIVARRVDGYQGQITNAACIIVDTPSAEVLARVGSADFFDTPGGGQVDAVRAERSPGSALKPFTYAIAMERDCLYSCERLLDSSLDYGLYYPENYDRMYRGLVSASYALKRSLNVPAVIVLERVGYDETHSFLQSLGLTTLHKTPEYYGLGLTLGNCEMRLDELAAAYCMLASLGEYRPLKMLDSTAPAEPVRRLSEGTCLEVYGMLEHPLPSELEQELVRASGVVPRAAWKTGTSTNHRDAWAFVFNRHYVVGVWMGNNDASPSQLLVGARAALPLAARVFRSLPLKNDPAWPDADGKLRPVIVCAASGLPATEWCHETKEVLLPRAQFLHRRCTIHWPDTDGEGIVERWPGKTKGWDLAAVSATVPAQRKTDRPVEVRVDALRILSPANRGEYVLTGEANGDVLSLKSSLDAKSPLHWYLDDRYLGKSKPDNPLQLALDLGEHNLTCMATDGAVDSISFTVVRPANGIVFAP